MLLNDIYYEAGELEHTNADKPSWAKPYESPTPARKRQSFRSIVGHALMGLGRAIAAEPSSNPARVRAAR